MNRKDLLLGLALTLIPAMAFGWWNEEWKSRRQLTVDATVTGADIHETLTGFPLLVRLHAGNFGYFAELAENGRDIRFMKDDQVALKHQVEKIDAFNELGLVWVTLPEIRGGTATDALWMYYGNANAEDGSDGKGLYDVNQALVYHFVEGETLPQDATAYASHAGDSKATVDPGGWIGAAAKFTGAGPITVNPMPQLAITPEKGWSFSAWVKLDQPQTAASLLEVHDGANKIQLALNDLTLVAHVEGAPTTVDSAPVSLAVGKWQHVGLVLRKDALDLYVDGDLAGTTALTLVAQNPSVVLGRGLVGLVDEVQIASVARSADWLRLSFRSQSQDFSVLNFGQDESNGSGGDGHFMVIVQNVTLDGWVVIGLTAIMFIVAVIVMVVKGMEITRVSRGNQAFLEKYRTLDAAHLSDLYQDSDHAAESANNSESNALFERSTLFHLYHAGISELRGFLGDDDADLVTPEAWNLLRVRLDSQVVRETQRLNSNIVLLTIAIAGGPFLGLLGTVMGVMITFATIAASGDVNINAIAPGIAAALLATVAGLAVAIPALFAYNYLLTRIKEIVADMRVFTDEFLAELTMRVARKQRRGA
jgi:biopolymer transport protein ExbB